ncbi:MAG: zinc-ribbon domain-containing protein [Candidatus Thorarchaeota archaeon]
MVRHLHLNFLFKKEGTRIVPESDGICLASALATAEALKGHKTRIVSLSAVSFPFWIVQTSPTKSIVLAASSSLRKEFQFTDMKAAGEVKRIISTDLSQATDIPSVASKIQPLIERVESLTADIANITEPSFVKAIGNYVLVSDPGVEPNRIEILSDSAAALKRTEEFRSISESAKLRIESAETLKSLIRENFGAQTTILENLTNLEKERGNERVRTMEERTRQEIANLTKKKEDKIYELREKHKINLRAMTADFSRTINDLEQFFGDIVSEIRNARAQIGQKEADTEGAISIYNRLVSSLKGSLTNSQQPIDMMDMKKAELEKRVAEAQSTFESEKIQAENLMHTEIQERNTRIDEARRELDLKVKELDDLKTTVDHAISRTEQLIENRVLTVQQEFLGLMNWTLDNSAVNDLAPLTLLDIHMYVATYDDKSRELLTPCFLPDGNLLPMGREKTLSNDFDSAIKTLVDDWLKNDQSFKGAFDRVCLKGNMLLAPEAEQLLVGGLEELLRRRLVQRDDIERLLIHWSRYSGKCPKCGAAIESGAQYCQKCGMEIVK